VHRKHRSESRGVWKNPQYGLRKNPLHGRHSPVSSITPPERPRVAQTRLSRKTPVLSAHVRENAESETLLPQTAVLEKRGVAKSPEMTPQAQARQSHDKSAIGVCWQRGESNRVGKAPYAGAFLHFPRVKSGISTGFPPARMDSADSGMIELQVTAS